MGINFYCPFMQNCTKNHKNAFCSQKPFLIYLTVLLLTIASKFIFLDRNIFTFKSYFSIASLIELICMLLVPFITIIFLFVSEFSIAFSLTAGPFFIILQQLGVPAIIWAVLSFLLIFLMYIVFGSKFKEIIIFMSASKKLVVNSYIFKIYFVYLILFLTNIMFGFYIMYFHSLLNVNRWIMGFMFILTVLLLIINVKICSTIFEYIIADFILTKILSDSDSSNKCSLQKSLRNLRDNLNAVNCEIFTIKLKNNHGFRIKTILKILTYVLGFLVSSHFAIFIFKAIFDIPLMAMYKTCKCTRTQFGKFETVHIFLRELTETSMIIFGIKWILIGIAGTYQNIWFYKTYFYSGFILDKDIMSRMLMFYAWYVCFTLSFDIIDTAWKCFLIIFAEDEQLILKNYPDVYNILKYL